jgi:hypothetical protein
MKAGKRLVLNGGDGDQSWFSVPVELEAVEREWFNPETSRGRGCLVQVVSGQHTGKYIALTSKILAPIDDQLAELKQAMVVVNVVRRPGPNFRPDVYGLDAVGMGVVELVG